ncbi:MAG: HD domain-containing protein [Candidatus Brocadiia bacterium]
MMKKVFVDTLESGMEFASPLLIKNSRLLPSRSGNLYIDLELVDRSGRIKGKIWDASKEDMEKLAAGKFAMFRGRIEKFKEELQIIVEQFTPIDQSNVDLADFLPTSRFSVEDMVGYLKRTGASLSNPDVQALWDVVLADATFMDLFSRVPAAVSYHHVFVGGLLEHTCQVVRLADAVASARPDIDRDLLLIGALLHDCGKVGEYSPGPAFGNLDRGLLLGHIFIGAEMVDRWSSFLDNFPDPLADAIKHMILSHHGTREFGSPVEPASAEAMALHFIDNMDTKVESLRATIAEDMAAGEEAFTRNQSPMLKRRVYRLSFKPLPEEYNPFAPSPDGQSAKDDLL